MKNLRGIYGVSLERELDELSQVNLGIGDGKGEGKGDDNMWKTDEQIGRGMD